jgi:CHAT domain-containing protein
VEGRRANERRFRQALAEAQVVHVATHGTLNVLNPLFSFLEFAPGPEERAENDGRLEIHEVLGLAINSSLVFLSGCETGLGASWSTEFERGEDYATGVVPSPWTVSGLRLKRLRRVSFRS